MKRVPPPLPPRARKPGTPSLPAITPGASNLPTVPNLPLSPEQLKAQLPPMRAPMPSDDGFMTTPAKLSLADMAFALRDEQLTAKVELYRADLATNPDLDAITAQVVAELRELQAHAVVRDQTIPPNEHDRAQIEIELIDALKTQLARVFRLNKLASTFERKIAEASKRFARLFFESELHEKIRGSHTELKTLRFSEQALYRVFTRFEQHLLLELESFEYESEEVLGRAKETFERIVRELRNGYLGRTTPELNALVSFLNEVLNRFLTVELPPLVGDLAWQVVKEAKLADLKMRAGYKVSQDGFPRFREAFERHFLRVLVPYVEEEMLTRVRSKAQFRVETIRFVSDPQIFSDVCELVCDATYDALYNDGFLDLPADWRAHLADSG